MDAKKSAEEKLPKAAEILPVAQTHSSVFPMMSRRHQTLPQFVSHLVEKRRLIDRRLGARF